VIEIILLAIVTWIVFFAFGYWCGKTVVVGKYQRYLDHLERRDRHGEDHT